MIYLFHNSRCGKSRDCLALLKETKANFQIIKYLEKPPTFDQLSVIIEKLGYKPIDLIRKTEKIWIEKYKSKTFSDHELIQLMIENPILIERPIVINGEKAVVARPFDKAREVL